MPQHPFAPVFDAHSTILILGSFPSVKSREEGFYYAHPRNRFWRILSDWAGECLPETVQARRDFCLRHGIALWDVLESCEIIGSSDASIREAKRNDLRIILDRAPIQRILLNGKTADRYFERFQGEYPQLLVQVMPSTSPANASWNLEKLENEWFAALGGPNRDQNGEESPC